MIPEGIPQHIGRKTLVLMILQGALPGIIFLFFVILLSAFEESINSSLVANINTLKEIVPVLGDSLQSLVPSFIPIIFFLGIIFGGIGIIINALRYKFFLFTLEEFSFKLRKGVLRVEEISIPYRQMQNVDVTRPFIYRILGISRLVVISAGNEQSMDGDQVDTVFDPIDKEIAEEIREILDRRIGIQVIEHETEADRKEAELKARGLENL